VTGGRGLGVRRCGLAVAFIVLIPSVLLAIGPAPVRTDPPPVPLSYQPPVRAVPEVAPLPPGPSRPGPGPGLYGGTMNNSTCDSGAMVAFLRVNPDKAAAWARVQGISTADIPAYIAGLRPVALRAQFAVTNHGFTAGEPTPLPFILPAGTAILIDSSGIPRTLCYCGNPLTPDTAVAALLNDCKKNVAEWRPGQVKYPGDLPIKIDESATYAVSVDARNNPMPMGTVIPGPSPQIAPIAVHCVLNARLDPPADNSLDVDNKGWIERRFSPTGVVNWTWWVTARAPDDHDLQLKLEPALATDGGILPASDTSPYITTLTTHVHVDANTLTYWWRESWEAILTILGAIGAAILGLLKWSSDLRDAIGKLRRGREDVAPK
jgi:uncharacterized protein DUF6777